MIAKVLGPPSIICPFLIKISLLFSSSINLIIGLLSLISFTLIIKEIGEEEGPKEFKYFAVKTK